nr:uncharacterized protein LOC110569435 [Aotus nancymaae]
MSAARAEGSAGRAVAGRRRRRLPGWVAAASAALGSGSGAGGGVQAEGGGGGWRPDRREGQGKLSARRRAAPVAKPPLPAPARWCTSLSFSVAHSLTSWLEIPTDVERAHRQTDTRAHAAGAGGGVAGGGGGSPRLWGRPAARPGLASGLGSRPSGPLRGAGRGARLRRPGRPGPLQGSGFPAGRSRTLRAGAGRDAPGKRLPGPMVRERRRRGGGGRAADRVMRSRDPKGRPEQLEGRRGSKHARYKNKAHLYIPFKCVSVTLKSLRRLN